MEQGRKSSGSVAVGEAPRGPCAGDKKRLNSLAGTGCGPSERGEVFAKRWRGGAGAGRAHGNIVGYLFLSE